MSMGIIARHGGPRIFGIFSLSPKQPHRPLPNPMFHLIFHFLFRSKVLGFGVPPPFSTSKTEVAL